jgi:hypothetical protein
MANAITASSGTTSFAPSLGDLVLDAFARCQIRSASLTQEHWFQARLSANIMFSEWSNVGMPLLWKVDEILLPLQPGIGEYQLGSNIIAPLDGFIRQYQLGAGQDFDPVITGTAGETTATVTQAGHSFADGDLAYFATSIAASGQIIQGAYLVATVIDADNYQIILPTPMDGTNSVALPVFTTTATASTLSILLTNHGLSIGKSFYCNVPVSVGGLTISGQLVVISVQDGNNFTVNIGQGATSTDSATMNSGQAQVQTQAPGVDATDFIMTQVSRTDYVSQADKGPNLQYRPTTFWFQRRRIPVITFWNPPDDNSAYVFHLWTMQQPQDAVIEGGVGVDVPYRYIAAFGAGLAARLAIKYPPPPASGVSVDSLEARAERTLQAALAEDIERVPLHLNGGFQSYFR